MSNRSCLICDEVLKQNPNLNEKSDLYELIHYKKKDGSWVKKT